MAEHAHVCPWWLGPLLASPLRRWRHGDPERLLRAFVNAGDTALDVGSGMGFFTIPLARLVGPQGRVVAVDLQEQMLAGLARRARRAGVVARIEPRRCTRDRLGIDDLRDAICFALAFAVVHEVPDAQALLRDIRGALRPGGRLLLVEPAKRVSADAFARTLRDAERAGFGRLAPLRIRRCHAALLA